MIHIIKKIKQNCALKLVEIIPPQKKKKLVEIIKY